MYPSHEMTICIKNKNLIWIGAYLCPSLSQGFQDVWVFTVFAPSNIYAPNSPYHRDTLCIIATGYQERTLHEFLKRRLKL